MYCRSTCTCCRPLLPENRVWSLRQFGPSHLTGSSALLQVAIWTWQTLRRFLFVCFFSLFLAEWITAATPFVWVSRVSSCLCRCCFFSFYSPRIGCTWKEATAPRWLTAIQMQRQPASAAEVTSENCRVFNLFHHLLFCVWFWFFFPPPAVTAVITAALWYKCQRVYDAAACGRQDGGTPNHRELKPHHGDLVGGNWRPLWWKGINHTSRFTGSPPTSSLRLPLRKRTFSLSLWVWY